MSRIGNPLWAMTRKDLLREPISQRLVLVQSALGCGFILWAGLAPDSTWLAHSIIPELSPVSQVVGSFLFLTPLLMPFVGYMSLIQSERQGNSFRFLRALPIRPQTLFWVRIICCWVLTLIPALSYYLVLGFMQALDLLAQDKFLPVLLSTRFCLLIVTLAWLVSTISVGLGMNVNPQFLPFTVTVIGSALVLFPFVFSRLIIGIDSQVILVKLARTLGTMGGVSLVLALLSLMLGAILSWLFGYKRSYF